MPKFLVIMSKSHWEDARIEVEADDYNAAENAAYAICENAEEEGKLTWGKSGLQGEYDIYKVEEMEPVSP